MKPILFLNLLLFNRIICFAIESSNKAPIQIYFFHFAKKKMYQVYKDPYENLMRVVLFS